MNQILKDEAVRHGDRLQVIAVEHLQDLKNEIDQFKTSEELNGFQQWIVNDLYQFDIPATDFKVKSVIIMAVDHPFYADLDFTYKNREYHTKSLVHADFAGAKRYLGEILNSHGYRMEEVFQLPFKRLAVQGGLAVYGRNNITYIDGLGSNFSYIAFVTDVPCETDEWRKMCHADICDSCNLCIKLCPTGAIRKDRFLIDSQRCLSCMNEGGGEFPEWLLKNVHHTLYDCLRCQEKCPMNSKYVKKHIGPYHFTEEQISKLLDGKGPEDFPEEFMIIADKIGLFDYKDVLVRNIRAIMAAAD